MVNDRPPGQRDESSIGEPHHHSALTGLLDWLATGAAVAEARVFTLYGSAEPEYRRRLLNALASRAADDCPYALAVLLAIIDDFRLGAGALRSVGVSEPSREDVEQAVLIAVARSIHRFRGESQFTTWLYAVARNVAVSENRKRRPTVGLDELREPRPIPGVTPRRLSSLVAERELIASAIAGLPAAFRETVHLRDVERLSYEQIAIRQDISVNTVKSRLSRGRQQLADCWDEYHTQSPMTPARQRRGPDE